MKNNQHEQLLTELTPAEAAVFEGGKGFTESVNFNKSINTQKFTVSAGATIELYTHTYSTAPAVDVLQGFDVDIRNVNTGHNVAKPVRVGNATTTWTNVRAGTYVIDLKNRDTDSYVSGSIAVNYS